jgi:hypothetical protein
MAQLLKPKLEDDASGPDLPLSLWPIAAAQLHQTCHSCIAQ